MNKFKRLGQWRKGLFEVTLVIGIVVALTSYLTHNMLATETTAPELRLHQLNLGAEQPLPMSSIEPIHWDAADKTLVYFFAPWCSVCRVSMAGLSLLPETNTQIITVALDWENTKQVSHFVEYVGFEGTVLLGDSSTKTAFQIDAYPSYYVVNNKGKIVHRDRGFTTPPGLWLRLN